MHTSELLIHTGIFVGHRSEHTEVLLSECLNQRVPLPHGDVHVQRSMVRLMWQAAFTVYTQQCSEKRSVCCWCECMYVVRHTAYTAHVLARTILVLWSSHNRGDSLSHSSMYGGEHRHPHCGPVVSPWPSGRLWYRQGFGCLVSSWPSGRLWYRQGFGCLVSPSPSATLWYRQGFGCLVSPSPSATLWYRQGFGCLVSPSPSATLWYRQGFGCLVSPWQRAKLW